MNPQFVGGVIFGALLMAGALAIFIGLRRRPRREPEDWTPEFHEPQPAPQRRLLIQERTFEF